MTVLRFSCPSSAVGILRAGGTYLTYGRGQSA